MFEKFKSELKENSVARMLQIIGYVELICAIIVLVVSIFSDIAETWGISINVVFVGSFIAYYIFLGFAEIIDLLHKNGKKKDAIYDLLKEHLSTNSETTKPAIVETTKSVIEDEDVIHWEMPGNEW